MNIIKRTLSLSLSEEEKLKPCKKWRKQAKKAKFRGRAKREGGKQGIRRVMFRKTKMKMGLRKRKRFGKRRFIMRRRQSKRVGKRGLLRRRTKKVIVLLRINRKRFKRSNKRIKKKMERTNIRLNKLSRLIK